MTDAFGVSKGFSLKPLKTALKAKAATPVPPAKATSFVHYDPIVAAQRQRSAVKASFAKRLV
jgi:hypothetical protein